MEQINPFYGHIHIYSNNIRDGYYGYNNENGFTCNPFYWLSWYVTHPASAGTPDNIEKLDFSN